ncbi:MAG: phosphoribosyltransferase [Archaeoglobaceae archaeon]
MKYALLSWGYAERLCRKVAKQVLEDDFKAEKIVALAKGGWFASMLLSDYLDVEVVSLNPRSDEKILAKKALLVDDFISTGKTMRKAMKRVEGEVKTSALLMFQTSDFVPDYLGEYISDDIWIIFPWNVVENLSALILRILEKGENDIWGIRSTLFSEFGIDSIALETIHPSKLEEILEVLEKRGSVEKFSDSGRIYWRLRK